MVSSFSAVDQVSHQGSGLYNMVDFSANFSQWSMREPTGGGQVCCLYYDVQYGGGALAPIS